jgi:DNA-binding transcriptional LysR family regulator
MTAKLPKLSLRLNAAQLDVFHSVVLTGSVTSAARMLHISQPAVSRQLAELERALGFALFTRDKKRLVITPEGSAFHDELVISYAGIERLGRVAEEIRELRRGHLRIAAMPALCFGPVSGAVARFIEAFPDVKVTFEAHNSRRIVDAAVEGLFDIGVTQVTENYPGLLIEESYRSRCVCVLQKGHALTAKATIDIADLAGHPVVALPPESSAGIELRRRLDEAGFVIVPRVETLTSFAAIAMVAERVGLAIVDPFTAAATGGDRIEVRAFKPTVNFNFRIVRPERRALSQPAAALLTMLREALKADPRVMRMQARTA